VLQHLLQCDCHGTGIAERRLSIYDYALAMLVDRADLDTILVGDSLAMTDS
jgi:ketopantoate hydroxymethyltransferase